MSDPQETKGTEGTGSRYRSAFRRGSLVKVTDSTLPAELRNLIGLVRVANKGFVTVVFPSSQKWNAERYSWVVSESHCLKVSKSHSLTVSESPTEGRTAA